MLACELTNVMREWLLAAFGVVALVAAIAVTALFVWAGVKVLRDA